MRKLLTILFSLLALHVRAANQPVAGLPTTNSLADTNYVIVVIPHLGANDTQLSNISNLFSRVHTPSSLIAGTNLLRFTNECYVTAVYGLDTNSSLSLSNAGLAAVNGIYRTNLLNGYTQGIYKVAWSPSSGIWVVSNATAEVYGFDIFGASNIGEGVDWAQDFLANPPPPTSWWGPVNVTNCFTVLASSAGLAQPMVSSNLYVSLAGNDTNALRGRIDRPWRNPQRALLASRPGDRVIVDAGQFDTPSAFGSLYWVSNRVSLIGAGRGVTIIGTAGGTEEHLLCASEVALRDFTFIGSIRMGALEMGVTSTNCLIDGCEILATEDIIHCLAMEGTMTMNNCKGVTTWDGLTFVDMRPGGSNRVLRAINCDLMATNTGLVNPQMRLIKGNDVRMEIIGGSLSQIGYLSGLGQAALITMDVDGSMTNNSGSVLCRNVAFYRTVTNGSAFLVTNFLNRTPIFFDNCTPEITIAAFTSGSFTNGWWHRDIAIPNGSVRTNRLVNTTSLTNALVAASEQGHRVTIRDTGGTASGTNIQIFPSGGQKINQQTSTNITTDYGTMTLMILGTNWTVTSKTP